MNSMCSKLYLVAAIVLISACSREQQNDTVKSAGQRDVGSYTAAMPTAEEARFLVRHWPQALPAMGPPPGAFSPLEASLAAVDCGRCHPDQYADWQGSRHSRSMGPGLLGQLLDLDVTDPESGKICRSCHAPLAEQSGSVTQAGLVQQGLVCAGCHVRKHRRFGPPATPRAGGVIKGKGSHAGFVASSAFLNSAFCQRCHQFSSTGFALNGKLIEDTYREWQASRYARAGVQCQDCHMPKRRHLWRGIHDRSMVQQAMAVSVEREIVSGKNLFKARIAIENQGAGHLFPTYATARIVVRAEMLDKQGRTIKGSVQEAYIGRELSLDLTAERYDTRIAPDETKIFEYQTSATVAGEQLQVELIVEPDAFYRRFFAARLESLAAGQARHWLSEALAESERSSFSVYRQVFEPLALPSAHIVAATAVGRQAVDWNDDEITWYDYRQGLLKAQESGKPMMMIFFAEWCPTCHAYQSIFRNPDVIAASHGLVMARQDVDQPGLVVDEKFLRAGDYVPRIFVVNPDGSVRQDLPAGAGDLRHFLPANRALPFLRLMSDAVSKDS